MIFLFFSFAVAILSGEAVRFDLKNEESGEVWVGILGNDGKDPLEGGGFVLKPGETRSIESPEDWAGRFWPRTFCDGGTNHCETGDCGNKLQCGGNGGAPPVTLAEITLKGDKEKNFYDISLVDGFNIGVTIEPIEGTGDGSQYSCKKAGCTYNFQQDCPDELQLKYDNQVIACQSACTKFNTDEYCCRGDHNTEPTCRSSDWPKDYPAHFKEKCPDAYSYAYDDKKSLFSCKADAYRIVFGNN